jgi:hypothetical protein
MAMNKLDMIVKTLHTRNAAKQDRIAASGSLAGMRIPPAVLSHEWRLVSPGLHREQEPTSQPTVCVTVMTPTTMAVKRAGQLAASRSGFLASCRADSRPFNAFQQDDIHDCLSNGCRGTQGDGLTGYQPGDGTARAYSQGK